MGFIGGRILRKSDFAVLVGSRCFVGFAVYNEVNGENFSRDFSINANILAYYRIRGERNGESFVGKPTVENMCFIGGRILRQNNFAVLVGSRRFIGFAVYYKANRENFSRDFSINANVFAYYRVRGEGNGEGFVGKPTVENVGFICFRILRKSDFAVLVGSRRFVDFAAYNEVNGECFFFIVGRSICAGFTCAKHAQNNSQHDNQRRFCEFFHTTLLILFK